MKTFIRCATGVCLVIAAVFMLIVHDSEPTTAASQQTFQDRRRASVYRKRGHGVLRRYSSRRSLPQVRCDESGRCWCGMWA